MNASRLFTGLGILLSFALLLISIPPAQAAPPSQIIGRVIYVAENGAATGSCGDSWKTTCSLQHALTSEAKFGDELWVKEGTYYPSRGSDRSDTFQLRKGIKLYGGFAGNEDARDQRNWFTNVTILSGEIGDPAVTTDNSYHVVSGDGIDNTAVLDGFTITGGRADGAYGSGDDVGGGMYLSSSSPTLRNLIFSQNDAKSGGGMYNNNSSPALTNITFQSNHAAYFGGGIANYDQSSPVLMVVNFSENEAQNGGGMYNISSSPVLTTVTFSGNTAGMTGGGMYNEQGSPELTDVTFYGNQAGGGGGMYNISSSPVLTTVTFSGNTVDNNGGGMNNYQSSPELTDVTFNGNTADNGGGMHNSDSSPVLTTVTFSSNQATTYGGGMYNSNSSPELTDVTFENNHTAHFGGGIANTLHSSPALTNVTFSGNTADKIGGGMFNSQGSPELTDVTFNGNTADEEGGGMFNSGSSPALTNVTFDGNKAGDYGGGMFNYLSSNPELTNVTFSGNISGSLGGGMHNSFSSPVLMNVTFSGNTADDEGGGMSNYNESSTEIRNTILWDNTANYGDQVYNDQSSTLVIFDSVVQGGCPAGSTCTTIITADPLLGTLGDYGGTILTIPLLPGSSAIGAGDDATCAHDDPRGVSRLPGCDAGAFESRGFTLSKESGDNQAVDPTTPFPQPLVVRVSSVSGDPVDGGLVFFSAPQTGAGVLFCPGSAEISGGVVELELTANDILGSYTITASTTGASAPVVFSLRNVEFVPLFLPLVIR